MKNISDTDFCQIEKHSTSAVNDLRTIQNAGRYPQKVCRSAMFGANMIGAQGELISMLRDSHDRLTEENQKLREALKLLSESTDRLLYPESSDDVKELANARNQAYSSIFTARCILAELKGGEEVDGDE
jgi:hypothetical protein